MLYHMIVYVVETLPNSIWSYWCSWLATLHDRRVVDESGLRCTGGWSRGGSQRAGCLSRLDDQWLILNRVARIKTSRHDRTLLIAAQLREAGLEAIVRYASAGWSVYSSRIWLWTFTARSNTHSWSGENWTGPSLHIKSSSSATAAC